MILQLGADQPSHIIAPALHKNRHQVRELFSREMHLPDLTDDPPALTEAARVYLREKFLKVKAAVCGANFLIADTGSICIVESEGNGRMCLTLPDTLIAIAGIEKVIPRFSDLEVLLQTLPRSATGERMNPYNSLWTGVTPGDGPQNLHVVLLDNGRSDVLADKMSRQTLQCIRCAACLNTCPVYRQTGGHAYGSVYSGPIGAILTPQLYRLEHAQSLPYASSLCGACYEVCPVKINIPEVLVYLRSRIVDRNRGKLASLFNQERAGMKMMARIFLSRERFEAAQRAARVLEKPLVRKDGWIHWLPGLAGQWTKARDLEAFPAQTFREWWQSGKREQVSREVVLNRVRSALSGSNHEPVMPATGSAYRRTGILTSEQRVQLFASRLDDYGARLFHSSRQNLRECIATVLLEGKKLRIVHPPGIVPDWLDERISWAVDSQNAEEQLSYTQIENFDGVLTGATTAVAESGSIVLQHGPAEGRRALTLLPDYHLCVLYSHQIVETLPECFERLKKSATRPTTFISGPSATADIEMTRIKGVHGPRFLDVILVTE